MLGRGRSWKYIPIIGHYAGGWNNDIRSGNGSGMVVPVPFRRVTTRTTFLDHFGLG